MARQPSGAKQFPRLSLPVSAFPPEAQSAISAFNRAAEEIYNQLNGFISLGTKGGAWSGHIDGEIIDFAGPVAGAVDFPIAHSLGRIPIGWISLSGGGLTRENTSPAHTTTKIWLRNTSGTVGKRFRILVV